MILRPFHRIGIGAFAGVLMLCGWHWQRRHDNAGIVDAVIASLTVEPAPQAPPINYGQAIVYIDAASAFQGSATNVTAITTTGRQGLVLTATGSGNPVTHGPAGFTFANGIYLQSAVLSG